MNTYGEEFFNVDEIIRPMLEDGGTINWTTFTNRLNDNIRDLQNRLGGGYVYFPPRDYAPTGEINIYPKITAIFAPGAVFQMPQVPSDTDLTTGLSRFSIVVQGNIQAGLHHIVQPSYDPDGSYNRRGTLLFQTDTIKEIHPEWFGAQSLDNIGNQGPDARAALQSAVDAAIHAETLAPIPIALSGRYLLSGPVYIGRRTEGTPVADDDTTPFILRGRVGPGNRRKGTLSPHPTFPAAPAASQLAEENSLLIVRGAAGFLIENVHFDASDASLAHPQAFSCLRIERVPRDEPRDIQPNRPTVAGDVTISRVRRCSFSRAAGVLVQIGEFRNPYGEPQGNVPPLAKLRGGRHDLLDLIFEGCDFRQEVVPTITTTATRARWDAVAATQSWLRDGVYYRAHDAFALHFLDCFWHGMMRAGIRAFGGSVTITNGNFHLSRVPVPDAVARAQDSRYSGMGGFFGDEPYPARYTESASADTATWPNRLDVPKITDARDNGCDIYVDRFIDDPSSRFTTALAVRSVESQSWRFLASFPTTIATLRNGANSNSDAYLENLHLRPVGGSGKPVLLAPVDLAAGKVLYVPPAIEWLGPFTLGASLLLNGVWLMDGYNLIGVPATPQMPATPDPPGRHYNTRFSGRVVMGLQGRDTRLVDLGTRTGGGFPDAPPDPAMPVTPSTSHHFTTIYKLASASMEGPAPVARGDTPWYLDLKVPPASVNG